MYSHELFGVRIDDPSLLELTNILRKWLLEDAPLRMISTPNPEFILLAREDSEFKEILNKSDLSLADGIGLQFAIAALTENFLLHRHTGVDTLELLAQLCHEEKKSL